MKCPRCSSNNTIKFGFKDTRRELRQRWFCKGCKQIFFSKIDSTDPIPTVSDEQKAKNRLFKHTGKSLHTQLEKMRQKSKK